MVFLSHLLNFVFMELYVLFTLLLTFCYYFRSKLIRSAKRCFWKYYNNMYTNNRIPRTEEGYFTSRENELLHSEIRHLIGRLDYQQNIIKKMGRTIDDLEARVKILERPCRSFTSRPLANAGSLTMPSKMTKSDYTPRKFETTKNIISVPIGTSSRGSPMRKWMSTLDIVPNQTKSSTNLEKFDARSIVTTINNPSISNLVDYEMNDGYIQILVSNRNVKIPIPNGLTFSQDEDVPAPEKKPQLHWSFGFRAKNRFGAVKVLPTSELIYSTGNVVILHNLQEKKQRFFENHTNQVLSLTLHPNRCIMASSQRLSRTGEKKVNKILVWDSISLNILYTINADHLEQIGSMSFSQSDGGAYLALIESSNKAHVQIFNTTSKSFVAKAITASGDILTCAWHPTRNLLAIHGSKNLTTWEFDGSSTIVQKQIAVFETDRVRTVTCFCFTDLGVIATGDSSGTITLWNTENMKIIKQAHSVHHGGITALTLTRKGYILTVGKDKTICEWDFNDLVRRKKPIEMPDDNGLATCITSREDDSLIVGTSHNNLFEGNFEKGVLPIIQGDSECILCCDAWGSSHSFVTGSKDGGLRIYNFSSLTVDYYRNFSDAIQCLSIDPSSSTIVLGFSRGTVSIHNLNTKEQILEVSDNTNSVCCVKYSPNGQYIFLARKNLQAFVYRVGKDSKLQQHVRFASLSAPIVNVDWDINSEHLRANSQIGHSYYWAVSGESISLSEARYLKWFNTSCKISFDSGCIQHAFKGFDNVIADEKLVFCGNKNGEIRLYRNPYVSLKAGFHKITAHSQPASISVINEDYFMSYGEDESSLLLWKLI